MGKIDQEKLGSGGYHDQAESAGWPLCPAGGPQWSSSELTRPFDKQNALPNQPEGFFLNFPNEGRGGSGTGAPVYYEFRDRTAVTYWFFFAFNDAPGGAFTDHEGDWERISIQLGDAELHRRAEPESDNRARRVALFAHDGDCVVPWSRVERFRGHPVVFSGAGTHASYPTPGNFPLPFGFTDKAAGGGRQWKTWGNPLDVTRQAWYGFGGAWGEVGNYRETTGPLGPSRFKPGAPSTFNLRDCPSG